VHGFGQAAPPWVDRRITLPRRDFAFDVGLGIGHDYRVPFDIDASGTGPGLNLEASLGITRALEIGFRTGFRFGDAARRSRADEYGRLFDRETYGSYPFAHGTVANPEFRIRGAVVSGEVGEIALEGRVYLPFERDSWVGVMFGLPVAFHLGRAVRIDTGLFVPVIFDDNTSNVISVPFDLWIQAGNRVWLGPMTGVRIYNPGGNAHIPLGFGLGYSVTSWLDWKSEFLFPAIDEAGGARTFGFGTGIQIRIE